MTKHLIKVNAFDLLQIIHSPCGPVIIYNLLGHSNKSKNCHVICINACAQKKLDILLTKVCIVAFISLCSEGCLQLNWCVLLFIVLGKKGLNTGEKDNRGSAS